MLLLLFVNLILNPATGYISPQFHCTYDDYFETPKLEGNIDVHWKRLAHLRENEETELFDDEFDMVHGKPLKEYEPAPSLIPLDEDEYSEYDSDSDESEGEIVTHKTRSGKSFRGIPGSDELYIGCIHSFM